MSSARAMLIDEFNREFRELNQYFIGEYFSKIDPSMRSTFFSNYDLKKINYLFGKHINVKSPDELFEILDLLFKDGFSRMLTEKNNGLVFIPVFIYLLNNNPTKNADFFEMCMKIHLTKDKKGLFSGQGLRKLEVPFRARMADTLEMVLLAPNFSTDLRTVINLLDYIDYEKFINGETDSEYSKYLQRAERELFAYFSFLASDELLEEFYKNREGNTRDYHYNNVRFNKDTLKLMSYYIDTNVRECKNKFFEFKLLEDRLRSSTDVDSRRNNMLVAFTYRTYPSSDFYDCFSDIELTMEDLVNFINHYEKMGNILSSRQLDNLLTSFRNRYLDVNGLNDDFNSLTESVRDAFDEYRKTRYAFLPSDFISYYNTMYKNEFSSFNFGVSTGLTRGIYEMIINGNNLIGFNDITGSKSCAEYISNRGIIRPTIATDEARYKRDFAIYNKYHLLLEESFFDTEFTIDYIIRKNVSDEDLESFMRLKKWFDKYCCDEKWDYSYKVLDRTFNQLQIDFDEELRNSPFRKRFEILYKYNDYVVHDQVSELATPRFFYKPMHAYEREFIENHGLFMFEVLMDAYNKGDELLPILDSLGLEIEDINLVFGSMGGDFCIKSALFQRKATAEAQHLEEVRLSRRQAELDQESRDLINEFVADREAYTIGEFLENKGISSSKLKRAREFAKENSELGKVYAGKIEELRAGRNGSGGLRIKEIYDSFVNGVKREDGTIRPFNYLDYKLMTDMPIKQFFKIVTGEFGEDTLLKNFVRHHQDLVKYNEGCLLGEKYVIMVSGKLHEVTMDEKLAAFDFIKKHDLPHEVKLYSLVIRGALNGDLGLDSKDSDKPKIYIKEDKSTSDGK